MSIVDRASTTAIEGRRARRGLDLYGKAEIDAVRLSQVLLERVEAAPDVDDLRMVRSQEPIDDPEALEPPIGLAGITILEQSRVSRLLEIIERNDIEMRDVEYRSARRLAAVGVIGIGGCCEHQ